MSAIFRHFAINADDVQRAKAFYENVLGWTFTPWGPHIVSVGMLDPTVAEHDRLAGVLMDWRNAGPVGGQ